MVWVKKSFLLFVVVISICHLTVKGQSTKDYDYYAFALEWAGTVCKFKNCVEDHSAAATWNLHGLWPNANNGQHPFMCTNVPTDWDNLPQNLVSTLGLYWSGLYSSQQTFLDHEWTKHGTCWRTDYGNITAMPSSVQSLAQSARNNKQNSADYFRLVVALSKNVYRIYEILVSGGITPSNTDKYTYAQIKAAMDKGFGGGKVTKFKVNCQLDESGLPYLSDVLICVDKNYNPQDCAFSVTSNCPVSGIMYPIKEQHAEKLAIY